MVAMVALAVNVIEHERILTSATRRYLRGEIEYDELTAIRREHEVDYVAALTALVRFQTPAAPPRRRPWWRWW